MAKHAQRRGMLITGDDLNKRILYNKWGGPSLANFIGGENANEELYDFPIPYYIDAQIF